MSWNGKRVLVTGACGFIGSHLVEELVASGARVTAFLEYNPRGEWGNLALAAPDVRDAVEVVFGDVRDPFFVRHAVRSQQVVFHLAALIGIPYSYTAPQSYVETNVQGTLNVLEACLRESVDKLVHTSTSEVYGTAQYVPIDEKHPLQGQSPYSASKIAADQFAESYYRSFDLPVATARPFNTYGPRQSMRAVIPTVLTQLVAGAAEIKTGSLEPVRDFTFVQDTARGLIAIAESSETIGCTTNLGYGKGVTIGELIDLCCEVAGSKPRVVTDERRIRPEKSEVMRLISDNRLAAERAGWKPEVGLREGLQRTFEFLTEHADVSRAPGYAV